LPWFKVGGELPVTLLPAAQAVSSRARLPAVDTAGLTALWARAWGDCRPVSYELRSCLHDRWVRFHSLPGSKRYAGSEQEYAELMRRHLAVLAELMSHDGADHSRELVVVTASWSGGRRPAPRAAELAGALPAAAYWTSVLTGDSIPAEETWTHLWASAARLHGEELPRLLRLVADDVTGGVIITTAEMGWLYHPYDGGADVIAASPAHRDQLRRAHADWLSAHPAGL
jgi:hypothetical protein